MSENPSADGYCSWPSHYIPLLTAFHTSWFKKFAFSTNLSLPSYIYIYISYVHMFPSHRNGLEVVHARCTWSNRQRPRSRRPRCAWIVQCKEVQIWYSKNSENNGGGVVEGVVLGGGSGSCIPMMYGWWFLYVFVTSMDDSGGTKWKWFSMVVIVWLMFL